MKYTTFLRLDKCFNDDIFLKLCTDALKGGWTKFKVKVGADLEDDIRRCRLIREMIGPNNTLVRLVLPSLLYLHQGTGY